MGTWTPKGAFIIDIDQQLSDPVRQKNFLPFPSPLFFHAWLAKDVIGVGPDVGGFPPPPSFLPPLHTPGHHAQDMKGGISGPTPPLNTYTAPGCGQTLKGPIPGAAVKVRCHQYVGWVVGRTANYWGKRERAPH